MQENVKQNASKISIKIQMLLNLKCKVNSIQIKIDCTLKENAKQKISKCQSQLK